MLCCRSTNCRNMEIALSFPLFTLTLTTIVGMLPRTIGFDLQISTPPLPNGAATRG
jgi:hypothetical protein